MEETTFSLDMGIVTRVAQLVCLAWKQPLPWVVGTDPGLSPGGGQ